MKVSLACLDHRGVSIAVCLMFHERQFFAGKQEAGMNKGRRFSLWIEWNLKRRFLRGGFDGQRLELLLTKEFLGCGRHHHQVGELWALRSWYRCRRRRRVCLRFG
ncbi:MAG: hypothetical protein ACI8T1_000763 [Verrucomicrobiales bacterium]|jgi:hypothetical protein